MLLGSLALLLSAAAVSQERVLVESTGRADFKEITVLVSADETAQGLTRRPLANLVFEVGIGLQDGSPWSLQSVETLARATTGPDGRAVVSLRLTSAQYRTRDLHVWAEPATPGFRGKRASRGLHARALPLRLRVERGGTASGLVVDMRGRPVAGAHVTLLPARGAGPRSSRTTTDRYGGFEVHVRETCRARVVARASGIGSGATEPLDLDVLAPPEDLRVVLRDGVELAGRVVDPGGNPLRKVPLQLIPFRLEQRPWGDQRARLEADAGLVADETTTDGEGRFSFAGLGPGSYSIELGAGNPRKPLAGGPFLAGGPEVVAVSRRHRVLLRVRDHLGEPLPRAQLEFPSRHMDCGPRILCVLADGIELPLWAIRPAAEVAILGDGLVSLAIQPERDYLVGFVAPDRVPVIREVRIPNGLHAYEVELTLPPPQAPGDLTFTVLDRFEKRLREPCRIVVLDERTGVPLAFREGSMLRLKLPPGDYRFRAVPHVRALWCATGVEEPDFPDHAPAEALVRIHSGEERMQDLVLQRAGRLLVTLAGLEGTGIDEYEAWAWAQDAALAQEDSLASFLEHYRIRVGGVSCRLLDEDENVVPVEFNPRGRGLLTLPFLFPGIPSKSTTPLRPGRYRLVLELPDGARAMDVEVQPGQITPIVVRVGGEDG